MDGFDYASEQAKNNSYENGEIVPVGTDSAYSVEFYTGKVPNFDGTDYQEVPHLRLKLAGQNDRVYDQPVIMDSNPSRPSDPERFPRQWAAFKRGELHGNTGTLLSDWDRCEAGDVRRYELQGITTVEQFAQVGEHQLHGLGPGSRIMRDAARMFLSAAPDPEKAALRSQLAEQADAVTKMSGIVEGLLGMLTPEQRAALEAPKEPKPKPKRQPAAA